MNRVPWIITAAWALVACSAPGWPRDASEPDAGYPLQTITPDADTYLVTLKDEQLPDWLITGLVGDPQLGRQVRVVVGRPVQLLVLPDTECLLEIPAMRAKVRGYPERYQSTWFVPVRVGTFDIRVTYGDKLLRGHLVVVPVAGA